tara:strand:- start:14327 stop:14587 length:261 start_codon:yes stop_codon:yes gene_type:complete
MSIKTTYVALDYETKCPVIAADSYENLKLGLDNYCGTDEGKLAKFLAFKPYDVKYEADYEGYFEYECYDDGESTIVKFLIFIVPFY